MGKRTGDTGRLMALLTERETVSPLDQLLAELFDEDYDTLTDDLPFAEAPGWDSLKHAELIIGLEQRCGVELTRDDIGRITSRRTARDVLAAKGHAG